MNSSTILRSKARHLLYSLINPLPTERLEKLLINIATQRAKSLQPADGLRFLFNIDAALYATQGKLAIAYNNGIHTKHKHTKYHDFFVERINAGETVLDIGCGNGALAYDIAEKSGAKVVGIDFNQTNINLANELHSHSLVQYKMGDALQDLPKESFDVVVLSNVLEHLPNRPNFLQQIQAQINPNHILIRVPLFEREWRVPLKKELGVEWRLDSTHETEYTVEQFQQEITEAKMSVIHQEIHWSEIWAEVQPNVS